MDKRDLLNAFAVKQATTFNDFLPSWKVVCYAIISCNHRFTYGILARLFKYYNFKAKDCAKCYQAMLQQGYLIGDANAVFTSYGICRTHDGPLKVTYKAFDEITSAMTEDDIKTSALQDVYSSPHSSYFLYEAYKVDEAHYIYFLRQILAKDITKVEKPSGYTASVTQMFDLCYYAGSFIYPMLKDPKRKAFFDNQNALFYDAFYEYFSENMFDIYDEDTVNTVLANLGKCIEQKHTKSYHFLSWAVFLKFINNGHPEQYLEKTPQDTVEYYLLKAIVLYLEAQNEDAVKTARKAFAVLRTLHQNNRICHYFDYYYQNFFYGLILHGDRLNPATVKIMKTTLNDKYAGTLYTAMASIICAADLGEDPYKHASSILNAYLFNYEDFNHYITDAVLLTFECVKTALQLKVKDENHKQQRLYGLRSNTKRISKALSYAKVIAQIYTALNTSSQAQNRRYEEELGMDSMLGFTRVKADWEKQVDALIEQLLRSQKQKAADKNAPKVQERIAYFLHFEPQTPLKDCYYPDSHRSEARGNPYITLKLQKAKSNGKGWYVGKNAAVSVFGKSGFDCMTEEDRHLIKYVSEGHFRNQASLSGPEVAYELIGNKKLFNADTGEPLEIVKGSVQITIKREHGILKPVVNIASLVEDKRELPRCFVDYPKNGVAVAYKMTDAQYEAVQGISKLGNLPTDAEDKLTKLLELVSSEVPVLSDLLKSSKNLKQLEGDTKVVLQLSPVGEDLYSARAVVYPAPGSKLVVNPGEGQEFIATTVNNETAQINRKLKDEKQNFETVEKLLTPIEDARSDRFTWEMTTLQCLTMLDLVRESKDCTVQWPEGAKLKVSKPAISFAGLNLAVNSMGSWFEVSGEVNIDPKTKMKVAELLRLIREAQGNFIALGDHEYVALSESLKKQLATLDKMASSDKKKVQISKFNSGVLNELEKNGAKIAADAKYAELKERIENAQSLNPQLPKKLNASLRDYQEEGFNWMMRLASWGAGAVLADDMGLGTTIQTISVLLSRSQLGPQLVVLPAALLINWRNELNRFAPSLKPVLLNFEQDRAKAVKKASKNSIILVTYGVVTEETEALEKIDFATAVFDEAHNIKNRDTKAFKSCVKLHADFRIMLTGTPLQNHLTEIWSLFEVAVPGLLGSYNAFSERFVGPIERDHDHNQQRLLKRIVSPFILRRTKGDVLNELPEKTEITLEVELSDTEKAFYNQIREETAQSLSTGEINPVQALAALTKLRQAACSMELIDKKLAITSSKTQTFLDLVDELIENNHRALVFSQFTSHLAIIRRELEQKGIEYLYLDGSMSPKERMKLVDEFDEGQMPLFLISLKAGGTGLNLTAADYVIHLDPWWNPAIEDQASDRAYRIGQERQVTVYRLIAKGTVEDKIIKLHSTKKSLADALLEGTEMSARLGREEILELLTLAQD